MQLPQRDKTQNFIKIRNIFKVQHEIEVYLHERDRKVDKTIQIDFSSLTEEFDDRLASLKGQSMVIYLTSS